MSDILHLTTTQDELSVRIDVQQHGSVALVVVPKRSPREGKVTGVPRGVPESIFVFVLVIVVLVLVLLFLVWSRCLNNGFVTLPFPRSTRGKFLRDNKSKAAT